MSFIAANELTPFYPANDAYVRSLSEKAAVLARDDSARLNRPQDIDRIARLALYDTIIYCGAPPPSPR